MIKVIKENNNILLVSNDNKWVINTDNYHVVLKDNSTMKLVLDSDSYYEDDISLSLVQVYKCEDLKVGVLIKGSKVDSTFSINVYPINESTMLISEYCIPGTLYNGEGKYIIPWQQGILFDTKEEVVKLPFNGSFASSDAYVNMIGIMAKDNHGIAVVDDYEDARYVLVSVEGNTHVSLSFKAILGRLGKSRVITLLSLNDGAKVIDYAKEYRKYIESKMVVLTLKDKLERYPFIANLIGSSVVHTGIHTIMQPDSYFYDKCEHEFVRPISKVKEIITNAYEKGINKIHLHLDGTGYAYDNEHPNFGNISSLTGGYPELNELKEYLHNHNSLFTIHDNYRDLYVRSSIYNEMYSIKDSNQEISSYMSHWAGGRQEVLCASFANEMFKRNRKLLDDKFKPDGIYTDVFTCNPMDECFDYHHPMTRTQCKEYRKEVMQEVLNQNMISSSEEVNMFALNQQITAHYAPYPCMMKSDKWTFGINIPFFSLVFHDCLVIPWMMDERNGIDYSLYALLNGGIPYLKREGAYPNTDGSFGEDIVDDVRISKCKEVAKLHELVAFEPIVDYYVSEDGMKQMTNFNNKVKVYIDLNTNEYRVEK